MRFTAATRTGAPDGHPRLDALCRLVGRLMRHPAYRRGRVVSPMLLRHLPVDSGYAWQGEAALRQRLAAVGLMPANLEHLIAAANSELERLRKPTDI